VDAPSGIHQASDALPAETDAYAETRNIDRQFDAMHAEQ